MKVLIAGCGYVGTALGTELVNAGHEVWGLRRDSIAARTIEAAGIRPVIANLLHPETLKNLPQADTVVLCQAPSHKKDEYRETYFDATKNFLSALPERGIRKIILISSTSVYSATDGSWVDELTDPMDGMHADAESRERAKVMLSQELLVLASSHPTVVFRLAGIYGPGRNRIRSIREGGSLPTLSDAYMNRIHLHDIVRGIRLLIDKGVPGQTYIGCDDLPCTQREFYMWVYDRLGLALPAAIGDERTTGRTSNKRCSNRKLRSLGLQLRYPNYRDGYQPLIDKELSKTSDIEPKSRAGWFS